MQSNQIKTETPKHTPGPWFFIDGSHENKNGEIIGTIDIANREDHCSDRVMLGCTYPYGGTQFTALEEAKANACLIATAPELLATLIKVKKAASKILTVEMKDLDNALCEAIDVIEKATGGEL